MRGHTADAHVCVLRLRPVMPFDDHAQRIDLCKQHLSSEDPCQHREAALGQQHLTHACLTVTQDWIGHPHVKLEEEERRHVEIFVGPELRVVEQTDATFVVADVEHEPAFLDGQAGLRRQEMAFCRQGVDDALDDAFAEDKHTEPAEAGHVADGTGDHFVRMAGRIEVA